MIHNERRLVIRRVADDASIRAHRSIGGGAILREWGEWKEPVEGASACRTGPIEYVDSALPIRHC